MDNQKSATPRTDREIYDVVESVSDNVIATNVVDADFACTLERELNAAKAEIGRLREALERFRGQLDCYGCENTAEVALDLAK